MKMIIRGGMCVDGNRQYHSDVLIEDGTIIRVEPEIDCPDDAVCIDASGLYVLPGLIDAHTHYHLVSRGTVTADSFPEGSRLAAFGGVTTVIDFADHQKGKTLLESMQERKAAMEKGMVVDFALHQGVYRMHDQIKHELTRLKDAGVSVIKIFTTYKNVGYLIESSGLEELFTLCRDLKVMVTVHAEDDELIEDLSSRHGDRPTDPSEHPLLRPAEAEARAITYVGELAGSLQMPIYIVHLSSAQGLKALEQLRSRGIRVGTETTPHYLQLTNEVLTGEDAPLYIMTPPLRTEADNRALWDAVGRGVVPIIATDHCSFTREQKLASHDCRSIFPGIPGTEEMLPLIHTFGVTSGRITLEQMVSLLSVNPAKTFGIYPGKGSLEIGTDADLILFDPDEVWEINDSSIHSAAGYSPYHGTKVQGRAVTTIRRGEVLVDRGRYSGKPGSGRMVKEGVPGLYTD
jgi:dihydropyrimidinase